MSSGHAHDVKAEVRRYLLVFAALVVGTIVTVLASYIDIGHGGNIILALAIALVKGFLVAGFFMHLISERTMIYTILVATVFFFAGLMYLTLWSLEAKSLMHDPKGPSPYGEYGAKSATVPSPKH
jgi:cytochrome c oxidase subunit IV